MTISKDTKNARFWRPFSCRETRQKKNEYFLYNRWAYGAILLRSCKETYINS